MRISCRLLAVGVSMTFAAYAQRGPSAAYPINTASPHPPIMQFERKDRTVEVEVRVAADGHVSSTKLLTRSGNGVYDERVRGFWKAQPFVPALDADGRPSASVLRTRAVYVVKLPPGADSLVNRRNGWRFRTEVVDANPAAMADRIGRMTCGDLLWEYEFMRGLAPRAKLQHEEIFHVAFAMLIAAKNLGTEPRDSLIAQWDTLIGQTLDSCRAQPEAQYWRDAFVHVFESAAPVGVNVR
jgi:TonB C terminal